MILSPSSRLLPMGIDRLQLLKCRVRSHGSRNKTKRGVEYSLRRALFYSGIYIESWRKVCRTLPKP
jgi:hypothetical protein